MGIGDGVVMGHAKILDNGSDGDRWNLTILSEGYQDAELVSFHLHALQLVNALASTTPFSGLISAINVHRVDIASTDSGADDPATCGGTGATADTFLDAAFCDGGVRRDLLVVDSDLAVDTAFDEVINTHAVVVLVNSAVYGGSGTSGTAVGVAVCSLHPASFDIALHELGHSAFGLADEYDCVVGAQTLYSGPEPVEPNITLEGGLAANKWSHLVDPSTAMPTMPNEDCDCSGLPSPVPAGTVGAFEGAAYCHCGLYRGEYGCKMRNLQQPFCAVCDDTINAVLFPFFP